MPHLNGVIFQRDKWWIAQCLEHDIGAQALTVEDVVYELNRSIIGHIAVSAKHGVEPFASLPKAPALYWTMWEKAKLKLDPLAAADFDDAELPETELKLAA